MVDLHARKRLSEFARRLVTGRIANDDFDDAYYDEFIDSPDAAVSNIAHECWCLYSSDLLLPYRLTGKHAVDRKMRRKVAVSILFLRSGLEYEWPQRPRSALFPVLWLVGQVGRYCGGVLLVLGLGALATTDRDQSFWMKLTVLAATSFAFGIWCWHDRGLLATVFEPRLRQWKAAGDYDAWPFFKREDFYRSRMRPPALLPIT